jgi:hypothetical protein
MLFPSITNVIIALTTESHVIAICIICFICGFPVILPENKFYLFNKINQFFVMVKKSVLYDVRDKLLSKFSLSFELPFVEKERGFTVTQRLFK